MAAPTEEPDALTAVMNAMISSKPNGATIVAIRGLMPISASHTSMNFTGKWVGHDELDYQFHYRPSQPRTRFTEIVSLPDGVKVTTKQVTMVRATAVGRVGGLLVGPQQGPPCPCASHPMAVQMQAQSPTPGTLFFDT